MEVEANADITEALRANDARVRDALITLVAGKYFYELTKTGVIPHVRERQNKPVEEMALSNRCHMCR